MDYSILQAEMNGCVKRNLWDGNDKNKQDFISAKNILASNLLLFVGS